MMNMHVMWLPGSKWGAATAPDPPPGPCGDQTSSREARNTRSVPDPSYEEGPSQSSIGGHEGKCPTSPAAHAIGGLFASLWAQLQREWQEINQRNADWGMQIRTIETE